MDPFDFTGATALIAGGASGLGLVAAEALLQRGARVCLASRSPDRLASVSQELNARFNGRCIAIQADLASERSVTFLTDRIAAEWMGKLNIAINSAGFNVRNNVENISLDEWESIQRVNSTGAFLFSRAVFPLLKDAEWGRLIHIASIFGSVSYPMRCSYAASKGAVLQLVRTLALEWAPHHITVNALSPGPFLTDINKPVLNNPENYRAFCQNIPLGRFGEPEELATACLFLASRGSSYVTGADLVVDGGWTAG